MSSESAVLAHCIGRPALIKTVFRVVEPVMFYTAGHPVLAALLLAMDAEGIPIDWATVNARLVANPGQAYLFPPNPAAWLHTLMQWDAGGSESAALWHAGEVRRTWGERQAIVSTRRAADVLEYNEGEAPAEDIATELRRIATELERTAAESVAGTVPHMGDLLAVRPPPIKWRVPGLLSERDKVIWTGLDGLGKTEFNSQLAAGAAAGYQPFTGELHDPQRVLVYDLENEHDALLRRYWRIQRAVERICPEPVDRSRLGLRSIEAGIDITRPDHFSKLRRDVDAHRADILTIGPLSKIARGRNLNEEAAAVELCGALDVLRVEHNLAVLIEAHPSKEKGSDGQRMPAPRGSSYFLGWPVAGFGLRPHADYPAAPGAPVRVIQRVDFRGSREDRRWPVAIERQEGTYDLPVLPFGAWWSDDRPGLRSVQ